MSVKLQPALQRSIQPAQPSAVPQRALHSSDRQHSPSPVRALDAQVVRNLAQGLGQTGSATRFASALKRGLANSTQPTTSTAAATAGAAVSASSSASASAPPADASAFRSMSKGQRIVALDLARKACNGSGDPRQMDQVDLFRDGLGPQARAEYDRQLEALRNDPRVSVHGPNGEPVDLATRELALRGMLAATFPDQTMLNNAIQTAVDSRYENGQVGPDGQGKFDVIVYPDSFDIANHTYPGASGQAPGLKTQDGDCVISQSFLDHTVVAGENVMTHEFAHCLQSASSSGGVAQGRGYPADFPFAEQVDQAFASDPAFQQLLKDQFGIVHGGAERFPTLQVLFRCYPHKLKDASPELYDLMVRYTGHDPLQGTINPPSQRERLRPQGPSCPAEPPPQDDRPWWRRAIDKIWPF